MSGAACTVAASHNHVTVNGLLHSGYKRGRISLKHRHGYLYRSWYAVRAGEYLTLIYGRQILNILM